MHRRAELGIAAHWRYKERARRDLAFESKVAWLRSLMDWRTDVEDAREFVDTLKSDVLEDRVYVFTPKGKVLDLPAGSTSSPSTTWVAPQLTAAGRPAKFGTPPDQQEAAQVASQKTSVHTSTAKRPIRGRVSAAFAPLTFSIGGNGGAAPDVPVRRRGAAKVCRLGKE